MMVVEPGYSRILLLAGLIFLTWADWTAAQRDRSRVLPPRARDGGRHIMHWSGTTSSGNRRHVEFPLKSNHQKRTPIMRGDMEPSDDAELDLDSESKLDIGDSDIHPLSQAAYWYRHPGHRGSNTGSGLTSKPENG